MKIYIYYPRALVGNGGPTAAVWMWARSFLEAGAQVHILYDASLFGVQPLSCTGVALLPIEHVGNGRWRIPTNIRTYIEANSIVFLHSAFLSGNIFVANAARQKGASTVFVPHGAYERAALKRKAFLKQLWLRWERKELSNALAIHAFVDVERDSISEVVQSTPIVVAPTPIPLNSSRWEGGGGYISWFGRYDIQHKGLDLLIEAFSKVDANLRLPLRLRGRESTNSRQDVKDIVNKYNLAGWIDVGGEITGSEKVEFLRQSEFFVMPSRWESFSIALLEVLAIGVPSIVSDRMPVASKLKIENGARLCGLEPDAIANDLSSALVDHNKYFSDIDPRGFVERNLSFKAVGDSLLSQLATIAILNEH